MADKEDTMRNQESSGGTSMVSIKSHLDYGVYCLGNGDLYDCDRSTIVKSFRRLNKNPFHTGAERLLFPFF